MIGNRRRFSRSESLGPTTIGEASQFKMEFLSAFDDEAWDHLENGWERREHSDRRTERENRKGEMEQIEGQIPQSQRCSTGKRIGETREKLVRKIRVASV